MLKGLDSKNFTLDMKYQKWLLERDMEFLIDQSQKSRYSPSASNVVVLISESEILLRTKTQ